MNPGNIFLLSWDCQGLEAVINVTEYEKETAWSMLQDQPVKSNLGSIVQRLLLRARYNSQRHYEIYTVAMDDSITEQDVRDMFYNNPQGMADLIRVRGNQVFSDRVKQNEIKIV
jgi:hypothetical protein